jgi:hypothetical protein
MSRDDICKCDAATLRYLGRDLRWNAEVRTVLTWRKICVSESQMLLCDGSLTPEMRDIRIALKSVIDSVTSSTTRSTCPTFVVSRSGTLTAGNCKAIPRYENKGKPS